MQHTIRKLFRYNFQKKLFLSYTVLIIVVICLAVSLFLRYLFTANSFIIEENQKTLTQKTAQQIDGFLGSMDAMALQIMSDPRLVQVFSVLYSHPVEGNYFKQELAMDRELGRILMALNGPRLSMGRISLYNAMGDYVSAGYLYETSQVVEDTLATLDITGLEAQMEARRIRREIRGPHVDDWSNSGQDILSVCRPLKKLYSGRTFAVIEVQQSLEMFEKMLAIQDRAYIQAYVFDDAGGLVYPKNAGDAALTYLDTTTDDAAGEVSITEDAARKVASGDFDVTVEATGRDELRRLAEDFNTVTSELKSIDNLRSGFVSSVSHEFRTPITSIQGYAELLRDDAAHVRALSDEKKLQYCSIITEESARLMTVSSNLLRLSVLESRVIHRPTVFSLDEQIRKVILLLEPQWSAKNLTFDLELA